MTAILVVEDEPDLRLLMRVTLELEGHEVSEVADGEGAVALLRGEHAIDVVLLDLRMPGISGWDVMSELREAGLLADLRIVVFSAHMEPREYAHALREGARAYLLKPFTDEELMAALDAATA